MIKMYIGGEEVVSNKEFTIKEEMLSTSSTILNNCYPKSWEQDHDYISRFYYPKDYSKCLIKEENDSYQNYQISGNTEQNGTPTPTNPVDIINVTGDLTFSINDKNYQFNLGTIELCKINEYQDYIYYNNGWYLHKETGKYIVDTSQVTLRSTYNNIEYALIPKATDYNGYNKWGNWFVLCTHALFSNNATNWDSVNNANKIYSGAQLLNWWIGFPKGTGLDTIKAELEGCIIYYPLGTATDTLITDETLLNQLNFVGNELLFAGMVKNSGDISLNPRYPKYCSLEILDFKDFLSTGDMLDFVINEKTITEAIQMVIDAVNQYGFVLGNVNILNPNDVIGAYSTQNKSAYDVLQYLADISQARWSTRMIDENTIAIDFYDPTLMPSGIDIEYTKEWWETNKVDDLTFSYGTRDYRNKQVMLSNEVYGGVDYDETILADGYNNTFMTTTNIAVIKGISVNGESKTFVTNEDKELGIEADFYYTPGENTIEASDTYSAGIQIIVGYTPLVKGREVVTNSSEIVRINTNTGRKGVIARYEDRNDVLSIEELKLIGETYLKYKGVPEVILTLETRKDIYNVGESVYFDAPINELATDYMVKKKSTLIIATGSQMNVWYTYELTSSFNSETAINWFDNQRNKTNGNIAAGQYIDRNIDIEASANIIWDNLTITEVTVTGDNVLNSPLNSPFVQ